MRCRSRHADKFIALANRVCAPRPTGEAVPRQPATSRTPLVWAVLCYRAGENRQTLAVWLGDAVPGTVPPLLAEMPRVAACLQALAAGSRPKRPAGGAARPDTIQAQPAPAHDFA